MPRKAVWLVLSCLLAVSAILSSCSAATSTSTTTTADNNIGNHNLGHHTHSFHDINRSHNCNHATTATTTTPVQTGTLNMGSLTVYTNWGNASGTGF